PPPLLPWLVPWVLPPPPLPELPLEPEDPPHAASTKTRDTTVRTAIILVRTFRMRIHSLLFVGFGKMFRSDWNRKSSFLHANDDFSISPGSFRSRPERLFDAFQREAAGDQVEHPDFFRRHQLHGNVKIASHIHLRPDKLTFPPLQEPHWNGRIYSENGGDDNLSPVFRDR